MALDYRQFPITIIDYDYDHLRAIIDGASQFDAMIWRRRMMKLNGERWRDQLSIRRNTECQHL